MKMLIIEVEDGQAKSNLSALLNGQYPGIEFEVLNVGRHIPEVTSKILMDDYFHYLHAAPTLVGPDGINLLAQAILKNLKWVDFLLVPVGSTARDAILGYAVSWILSYADVKIRGAVYYAKKEGDEVSESLREKFEELFGFEKVVTRENDILYLDMQPRQKGFFKTLKQEENE